MNEFFSDLTANSSPKKPKKKTKKQTERPKSAKVVQPKLEYVFTFDIVQPLFKIDELLVQVFIFSDLKTIYALMQTCQDWYDIISSTDFWKILSISWFPDDQQIKEYSQGKSMKGFRRKKIYMNNWMDLFRRGLQRHNRKIIENISYKIFCEIGTDTQCDHNRDRFNCYIVKIGYLQAMCSKCDECISAVQIDPRDYVTKELQPNQRIVTIYDRQYLFCTYRYDYYLN